MKFARVTWSAIVAFLVTLSTAAFAQVSAYSLAFATMDSPRASVATVRLHFRPIAPPYRITSENGAYLVILAATTYSAETLKAAGPVKSIDVSRSPAGTSLLFATSVGTQLNVVRSTSSDLLLNFSEGNARAISAAAPAGKGSEAEAGADTSFAVVLLRFADASEVAAILSMETATPIAPSDTTQFQSSLGALQQVAPYGSSSPLQPTFASGSMPASSTAGIGQRIDRNIAIDRRLNALVVNGSADDVRRLSNRARLLDIPVKMVTLEAEIYELTESAARNVGLVLSSSGAAQGGLVAQSFQKPQFTVTLQAQILAEIQKGGGRLIASPRVQTQSGTSASILTGDALPVVTTLTYPGNPPLVQQQIQYVNVGVHLQISPRVTADGLVQSRILAEVSNVTAFIQGNVPQLSQRQATTSATVRDGEPYVIGGLTQDNEIRSVTKLPVLGDIPIVGGLFRADRSSSQRTNIYIVVTPHVSAALE